MLSVFPSSSLTITYIEFSLLVPLLKVALALSCSVGKLELTNELRFWLKSRIAHFGRYLPSFSVLSLDSLISSFNRDNLNLHCSIIKS